MPIFIFFVIHWYLSLFTQSFFLHRYGAHKMFTLSPFWEKFFFVFTWICQGSSFLNARAYAIMHRMHHTHSDTQEDPHSPHFFKDVFSMTKHTLIIYKNLRTNKIVPEKHFDGNYPVWPAFERFAEWRVTRISWVVCYITFYAFFATHWWMWLLLPVHVLSGPIHGAIVNWGGHKYGYQNFDNKDHSKNTLFFDFITLGELFQNNHHKYANSPTFAHKWYEIDPIYPVMLVCNKLGIIRLRKNNEPA